MRRNAGGSQRSNSLDWDSGHAPLRPCARPFVAPPLQSSHAQPEPSQMATAVLNVKKIPPGNVFFFFFFGPSS